MIRSEHMPSILKFISCTVITLAFISGIINWVNDVAWIRVIEIWISGILFGIIFLALALILDHVQYIQDLHLAQHPNNSNPKQAYPEKGKNSKALLANAADYKMKHMD